MDMIHCFGICVFGILSMESFSKISGKLLRLAAEAKVVADTTLGHQDCPFKLSDPSPNVFDERSIPPDVLKGYLLAARAAEILSKYIGRETKSDVDAIFRMIFFHL